jgi:chemotaxis receptor (MCP) glutamine deamidase CheD
MIVNRMSPALPQLIVDPDAFRVARESSMLVCELHAAVAVCVHDDTQGVGGLLHLRYVATQNDQPIDLTDNTLSSDLLLMDRFCKELRKIGARKQSWRVNLVSHTPESANMDVPAATVLDLLKAYFADSRRPVECQDLRRTTGLSIHLESREGRIWVRGRSTPTCQSAPALASAC